VSGATPKLFKIEPCSYGFAGLASLSQVFNFHGSRLRATRKRLGEGGGFTAARTGAKLENPH